MSIIGTFVKSDTGFTGTIKTVSLNFKARLVETEGGAGWKRTAENSRAYISIKLDDPSFPHPIYASLFEGEDPDTFNLLWSRPRSQ
ncbi:DUF736 domain-containing protein [Asticcacaulis excentricus]|uniref:DUF736 domain-containing protein n=1 Tax=Asticcacaulis excentricus TaxID=78587 RepID=A0A3G9FXW1_9CAUL|nr:DUF736 domain-containing protein [Asticcacaulis excentricus]BBF79942.1 protein of unknown function DUF736 [Asticcacaulis excentricus]